MSNWPPNWAQPNHPLQQREERRWQRLGLWQGMRWGCLPLILLLLGVPVLCMAALMGPDLFEAPLLLAMLLIGIVFTLDWLLGFAITVMGSIGGALTIAPERGNRTWELLRVTALRPVEILGSKASAALFQLWPLVVVLTAVRVLSIGLIVDGVVMVPGWAIVEALNDQAIEAMEMELDSVGTEIEALLSFGDYVLIGLYGVIFLASVAAWLLGGIWKAVYSTLVGTFASTLVRSSNGAIALALGLQFVVGMAVGMFASAMQQTLFSLSMVASGDVWLSNPWFVFFVMFVFVSFIPVTRLLIMLFFARLTLDRIRYLPD